MDGKIDRHTGVRENVWFSQDEHVRMLEGMKLAQETNKSNFIREAVAKYVAQWKGYHE